MIMDVILCIWVEWKPGESGFLYHYMCLLFQQVMPFQTLYVTLFHLHNCVLTESKAVCRLDRVKAKTQIDKNSRLFMWGQANGPNDTNTPHLGWVG